jgi:ubiquinone/menaquinone biosynthesis C-methylase UbiE
MSNTINAEHIGCWSNIVAPKYTHFRHVVAGGMGAHSDAALERFRPAEGSRVLDVGCGMGESTAALARCVGPSGAVVGIDGVPSFLDIARREAAERKLSQVTYLEGDAQVHSFDAQFDYVFSRFGTMFFQSPVARS